MSKVLPDGSTDTAYLGSGPRQVATATRQTPSCELYSTREVSGDHPRTDSGVRQGDVRDKLPADERPRPVQSNAVVSRSVTVIETNTAETAAETHAVRVTPLTEDSLCHAIPYVPTSVFYACIKRAVDMVGAVMGLLLLSPIMAVCALLIKLHDGGPVFFRQARVGERGELFQIIKFRSMVIDADAMKAAMLQLNDHADDRSFKIFNDPRVTRVGRVMRRMSLDELPQFWNVLAGQMSLVGPRPALLNEVLNYDRGDLLRLAVKPGLTCIWQVSGRSRLDFPQQVKLDKKYIEMRSVGLDLKLIAMTVPAVFCGDGAA